MKIKSLDGLRVLFCLCVYTAHAHLMLRNYFSVGFFFMLSGFVLYYAYSDKLEVSVNGFRDRIKWISRHTLRFYPIHILMFIASIPIRWDWITSLSQEELLSKGFLNVTLLQGMTFNPYTFNYCSWYLSTLFILYLIAIPLMGLIKKSKYSTEMWIAFILVLQYIINYYFVKYSPTLDFIYSHPIYRVTDFMLGMLVAKMFQQYKNINVSKSIMDILQSILVVVFTAMLIASFNFKETTNYFTGFFVITIFIMAFDKGWLAEILSRKPIQKFAAISLEFYLCHELVLFILEKYISVRMVNYSYGFTCLTIWVIGLPISIVIAKLLNTLVSKKVNSMLRKKLKQI